MRSKLGKFGLPLVAAAMLVFSIYHVVRAQQQPPPASPPIEPARTPFGRTVAATPS